MKLSVVTTLYKSSAFLPEFYDDIITAINNITTDYEIIFVDDGSPDDSLNKCIKIQEEDSKVKIIELSRNFGHHYAAYAGLENSSGDLIFLIDSDLEINPNILSTFYQEIITSKADVVYGVQKIRKGHFIEKYFGGFFWKFFNAMSDIKIPNNVLTERLMTRSYLDSLLQLKEKNLFLAGNMYWVGYNQKPLFVEKKHRTGKSTYNLKRRINLLIEAITSFSDKPLRLLFFIGVIITFISMIAICVQFTRKVLYPEVILQGFTTLYILLLLSLGIIVSSLGLVSIYLSKVFKETKSRPLYIIKRIIKK